MNDFPNYAPAIIAVLKNDPTFDGPRPAIGGWSLKWVALRGVLAGTSLLAKAISLTEAHGKRAYWRGPPWQEGQLTEDALYICVVMDLISEIATEHIRSYPVNGERVVLANDPLAIIQRLSRLHDPTDRTRVHVREEMTKDQVSCA